MNPGGWVVVDWMGHVVHWATTKTLCREWLGVNVAPVISAMRLAPGEYEYVLGHSLTTTWTVRVMTIERASANGCDLTEVTS